MKIKKISICGFKSFADKIDLEFPYGVTAVVGPNGCGKSNVVDAIRWALGEQSAKQLRGKAMEDVIFNGSESRKPLGMAEVTLTFANDSGHSLPEYMEFSEIAIGRRLFRSGESEYSINKVLCRLKDITDLFLGTGIGHRAYSIVEQGKMDFVLNAKPEEKRVLIEEAAGITKYKDRKAAALRKMEATQQNLLRLSDVIGEIKRQMNSLNRQAKKAERFKAFRDEMRTLELGQSAQTCMNLEAQRREMQSSLQTLQDGEIQATAQSQELEAAAERIKVNLLDLEGDLNVHQERAAEKEGAIKNRETQIELASHERDNLLKQSGRAEEEIGKLQQQKEGAEREIQGYEGVLADLNQRLEGQTEFLAGEEEVLQQTKTRYTLAEQSLSREKNEWVDLLTREARLKNQLIDFQRRSGEFSRRREKMAREKDEADLKTEETRTMLARQSRQLDDRRSSRKRIEEERAGHAVQLKEMQESLRRVQEELAQTRDRMNQDASRLDSLLELQKNFEGYQEGVRAILLKRQAQGAVQNGIYGLVEDIVETEPQYETVVESVLGDRLQHVIVQDLDEGAKAIDYLKAQGAGRSSFVPLRMKSLSAPQDSAAADPAVTPLLDLIKVKEEFAHLAPNLFGDVWVVADLKQAIELWNRDSIWKTLVTLDGEVLHPTGVLTGGGKQQASSGTFHRKREIRDLTRTTEELRAQLAGLEHRREGLAAGIQGLESSIAELTRVLHQEELQILSEGKELDQQGADLRRWLQKIEVLQFEESQLADEELTLRDQVQENESALQAATAEKAAREESRKQQEAELQELRTRVEELAAEVTEVKVRLSAIQEKRQSLEQNLARAQRSLQETETLLALRREEIQEAARLLQAAGEQMEIAKTRLHQLLAEHQELQSRLAGKREAMLLEREKLEKAEEAAKECRQLLRARNEEKNALSMKLMETELNLKHLLANIEEKHRLSAEALFSRVDERDYFAEEVEARLAELKSQIEAMGEVNLLAIREYEEARIRLDFLTTQEADLVNSLEALDQAIKKINRTSRKRFQATFELVNAKFKETFQTLFGGGRAELVLLDESNLLETGVDIIAQPPGKKLQNVNLLSGGERALTAVALIFSLFLINPSPFCLMDEADAPLDDANIGRFNRMIMGLAEKYQFIIVTHNKSTMELADTLYGITMEEPGTSKLVSVKLN